MPVSPEPASVQPQTPQEANEQPQGKNKRVKQILIGLGIFVILFTLFMVWFILFGGNKNKTLQAILPDVITNTIIQVVTPTPASATAVSGTITFDGYAPPDAYIAITERTVGRTDFKDVVTGLVPGQDTTWTWADATHGKNYEIKALLKVKGKEIQESTLTTVSAPAQGVALRIVSEQQPPAPQQATITGTIHLDGYLPQGSTFSILSRQAGSGNFTSVISGLQATDNTQWSWNSATIGETYDMEVLLKDSSGNVISDAVSETVTAPSSGLLFSVSSNAQPPAPTITGVSGTILINGDIPSNSYISIGARKDGTETFNQVATQISATNGTSFTWPNAQSGQEYDIQAYLWSNGKPYAQSSIVTITAPSANNQLVINAQVQLGAPAQNTLNVVCNGQQNNQFQATINYNTNASVQNPQQYRIVVTQGSQGNQVINTTVTPGNPDQSQTLTTGYQFTSGTTYFAQYAYSTNGVFSPLSPSVQFACN